MRLATSMAMLVTSCTVAAAQGTPRADSVRIITSDVATFWHAYDQLQPSFTRADTVATFTDLYFKRATPGLETFIAKRLEKVDDLLFAMNLLPRYYRAVRANTLRLHEQAPIIRDGFRRLKQLYPATKPSDVYFVMGGFTTQGTTSDRGILIGAEMVAADSTTPMNELPPFMRDVDLTAGVIPCIVIHELVHEQQKYAEGKTLLRQALVEGVADFITEKAVGCHPSAKSIYTWGDAHERAQWEDFRKAMNGTDLSQWFYNGAGSGGRPGNLGYWMGYRIAASYYENAADKQQAIAELLNIQDFEAVLEKSGYARRFAQQQPIEVKVVVVTMFEVGEDTTDTPGEFQYWIEREGAKRQFDFPQGWRPLRMTDDGVLVMCTGIGIAKAAASVMALGMDPRFDLRRAYWVVAGIAGIDPIDGSTGSAAWAEYVIDGDLAHEIDAREIPADWPTGYIPLRKTKPYEQPRTSPGEGEVFKLDSSLVDWAYRLTKDIALEDTPAMQAQRARYSARAAQAPPRVMKGDVLSSSTYWHGTKLSEWANGWVDYFTEGRGNYVMTAMEDTGTLQALEFLHGAGRADRTRALVLRTASNFDQQRTGLTAPQSLEESRVGGYTAFRASVDAAHRVGATVVRELVRGWSEYREKLPN